MSYYHKPLFSILREFGFDDSDDDMFSDMGIRSRMNRMGHPFDWGVRNRRVSTGYTEPQPNLYEQYFPDEPEFAGFGSPHWDTFNTARKRNQHPIAYRSGFLNHLPSEFRQYVPDNFGFPNMRQNATMTDRPSASTTFQKPPHPQYPQQTHAQQQSAPQQFQQREATTLAPKPNLCDAAIQTEDIDFPETQSYNLKQHGLRNTVDLGQKSQQEDIRRDRAHSAPPGQDLLTQQQDAVPNIAQDTNGTTTNRAFSSTGTSMTPQCNNIQQPQFNAAHLHQQRQEQPQQQKTQQQHQGHPQTPARAVPIFVEGRDIPLVNKINIPQETSAQFQQNPSNQQSQSRQESPQAHQTTKPQNRPTPFTAKENVSQQTNEQSQIPPQTPHTTECINKIQEIQRDVFDLMGKIERFGGLKNDKEYMYLDEMLTRNLLKLDTIDTNGTESIRLARKEAIKCIQASIAVLDAKSEIHARPKEKLNENIDDSVEVNVGNVSSNEKAIKLTDEANTDAPYEAVNVPKHVSEIQINIGDESSNETDRKISENENSHVYEETKAVDDVNMSKEHYVICT